MLQGQEAKGVLFKKVGGVPVDDKRAQTERINTRGMRPNRRGFK
jgi:hypothetical protein